MTLEQLLQSTDGHAPGYEGAARDCLLEAATSTEHPDTWIAAAQVFATLSLRESIEEFAANYGRSIA